MSIEQENAPKAVFINRPGFDVRLQEFEAKLFDVRWISERVMGGQQFNCYEAAGEGGEEEGAEEREYSLCIGPITDARFICGIEGKERAELVEAAMKVATEAFREKITKPLSAAPDLLDALELADATLRGANMNREVVERKVRAAIAKARGES
jgi:hypothetical protein